jgi:hypothetical protein
MVLSPSNTNLTINLLVVNYVSISCMKRYFISTLLSLTLIALYAPAAHATSLAVTVDITAGCRGTVNGSSSITLPVESTQSSNITIFNANTVSYQNVSGPGISGSLAFNSRNPTGEITRTFNVGTITANTTITITPVTSPDYDDVVTTNYCPTGSNPVPSTIILTPIKPTSTPATTTPKTATPSTTKTTTPTTATTTPITTSDKKDDEVKNKQDISQSAEKKESLAPIYIWAFVGLTAAVIAFMIQKKNKNTKKTKSVKRAKNKGN